mgnify:CR=1 FL=1
MAKATKKPALSERQLENARKVVSALDLMLVDVKYYLANLAAVRYLAEHNKLRGRVWSSRDVKGCIYRTVESQQLNRLKPVTLDRHNPSEVTKESEAGDE